MEASGAGVELNGRDLHVYAKGVATDELVGLDVSMLTASKSASAEFRRRHAATHPDALDGLQQTVRLLVGEGHSRRLATGEWVVYGDGYGVLLNRSADRVLLYDTVHSERTLMHFRSGVKSSLKGTRVGPHGLVARLDDAGIERVVIPMSVIDDFREQYVFEDSNDELRKVVANAIGTVLDQLEEALRDYLAKGRPPLENGPARIGDYYLLCTDRSHVLVARNVVVTLRYDGQRVVLLQTPEAAATELEALRLTLPDGLADAPRGKAHSLRRRYDGTAWPRLRFSNEQASEIERAAGTTPVLEWMAQTILDAAGATQTDPPAVHAGD